MEHSNSKIVRIYELRADGNHFNGLRCERDDYSFTYRFNGSPIGSTWVAPRVETEKAYDGRRWVDRDGNFTVIIGVPVLDDRALEVLHPLIADSVELLPLEHPTKRLYAVNVLAVIECIDYERSDVRRASDGGILSIRKYFFKPGTYEHKHIFMVKGHEIWPFVSEEFKRRAESNGLLGFAFWSIGHDGELIKPEPPPRPRRKSR